MELRPGAQADAKAAARLQLWLERHWGFGGGLSSCVQVGR